MAVLHGRIRSLEQDFASRDHSHDALRKLAALHVALQHRALHACPPAGALAADAALQASSAAAAAEHWWSGQAPPAPGVAARARAAARALAEALHRSWLAHDDDDDATAGDGPGSGADLAAWARQLGCDGADAAAARLGVARRTLEALRRGGGGPGAAPAEPTSWILAAAARSPEVDALAGGPATLLQAARGVLPVLRQLPAAELALPADGWAALWALEPAALQAALAEAAGALASPGAEHEGVWTVLAGRPHWAALLPALRLRPELHLAARRVLRAWLAASGCAALWRLLAALVAGARQQLPAGGAVCVGLPPSVQVLYPPRLRRLAALMHCRHAEMGALEEVAADAAFAPPDGDGDVAVWHLLLDYPTWVLLALQHVGLDAPRSGSGGGEVHCAAAEFVARAAWPHCARRRAGLVGLLLGTARPGGAPAGAQLRALGRWRDMLQDWAARDHPPSAAV